MKRKLFPQNFRAILFTVTLLICGVYQTFAQTKPELSWLHAIGSINYETFGALDMDNKGNVYVAGNFRGLTDFDPSSGTATLSTGSDPDGFIAKYDKDGKFIWVKHIFGRTTTDIGDIKVDDAGDFIITGNIFDTTDFDPSGGEARLGSHGLQDMFLAKYDADGNYKWAHVYGGTSVDNGLCLSTDSLNNIYLGGIIRASADFDPSSSVATITSAGNSDILLAKYDKDGNYIWAKNMGSVFDEAVLNIAIGGGNAYITGYYRGHCDFNPSPSVRDTLKNMKPGTSDIFVAKYDWNGDYVWAMGMGSSINDQAAALVLDKDQNVFVTGYFNNTVDFDASSTGTANLTASGTDMFLAQYDKDGKYLWAKAYGGSGSARPLSMAMDKEGNLIVGGDFSLTCDFDPLTAAGSVSSAGETDGFNAAYDKAGNYLWSRRMGGLEKDGVGSIRTDSKGNVYVGGVFEASALFDSSSSTITRSSIGQQDIFFGKYSSCAGASTATSLSGATITASLAGAVYQWFDCDKRTIIAGATGQSYTATINGNYAVIIGSDICADTSACVAITTLGIGNAAREKQALSVYPNPSTGIINIELNAGSGAVVSIYNSFGSLVFTGTTTAAQNEIDLSAQASGMYLVKVQEDGEAPIVKTITIIK